MKMGIKTRLTMGFIVLITIPLLILGISSHKKAVAIMEENFRKSSLQLAGEIRRGIHSMMQDVEEDIVGLSLERSVVELRAEEMMEHLGNYIEGHKNSRAMYIGTEGKEFHMRSKISLNVPEGFDPTGRDWYKKAIEKKDVIWTDPYIDTGDGDLVISAAKPIYKENELVGVLGIDVSLKNLAEELNSIKIGENGSIVILNRELKIMTSRDERRIGTTLENEKLKEAINKNEKYVRYEGNEKGEEKIATIIKSERLGWTIVSEMNANEMEASTKSLLKNTVIIGGMALVIAISISHIISGKIIKNIKCLLEDMEKVKEGDFTVACHIQCKDEIGELGEHFNDMIRDIGDLVRNTREVSRKVIESAGNLAAVSEETSASSEEVGKTVEEIAKGATDQAYDAEKGVEIALRLSDKFDHLTNYTKEMLSSANGVKDANLEGVKAVEDLREKTEQNGEATESIEAAIMELDNKTKNIGSILDTIASISEQTNLLALNASIEAARAGDAGRGFAVVAEEIRKLAEGSRQATEEIKDIVINIQTDSSNTVESMKEVKIRSKEQSDAVSKVDGSFDKIYKSIDHITERIEVIGSYVKDLDQDKDEIVGGIQNISAVSEETAAAAEEVSATMQQQSMAVEEVAVASQHLNDLAFKLNEEIGKFRV